MSKCFLHSKCFLNRTTAFVISYCRILSLLEWAVYPMYMMLSACLNYFETSSREGPELDAGDTMNTNLPSRPL